MKVQGRNLNWQFGRNPDSDVSGFREFPRRTPGRLTSHSGDTTLVPRSRMGAVESSGGEETGHDTIVPAFSFATCCTTCEDSCEAKTRADRSHKKEYPEWQPQTMKQSPSGIKLASDSTSGIKLASDSSLQASESKDCVSQEIPIPSKYDIPVRIAVRPGRRSPSPIGRYPRWHDSSLEPTSKLNGRESRSKSPTRRNQSHSHADGRPIS